MPTPVPFLPPADLHDIVRGMAVVCRLYDKADPDVTFRLDPALGAAVGRWRDFDGNSCHLLFSPDGAVLLGFDGASPMAPAARAADTGEFEAFPGLYDQLPAALRHHLDADPFADDGFDLREVTFALWNTAKTKDWQKGDGIAYPARPGGDPDGQAAVLAKLRAYYSDFPGAFEETYQWDLDPDAVTDLLSGDRVSLNVVRALKPDSKDLLDAKRWLGDMGFVVDGG
jgi:hypothetical protein